MFFNLYLKIPKHVYTFMSNARHSTLKILSISVLINYFIEYWKGR